MKIMFHADDFAVSRHVSEVIASEAEAGNIHSISVMTNMSCFDESMKLFRERGLQIPVSVHLNIMEGFCLADKERIPLLVDEQGLFCLSWGKLLVYSLTKRKQLKEQLKTEFEAQIERLLSVMPDSYKLRIDSHQHPHMIPLVFRALLELIEEKDYRVSYIRIAREQLWPFISHVELWKSYSPANIVKNILLNMMGTYDLRLLKSRAAGISYSEFMGLVCSGCMDKRRVGKVLPDIVRRTKKNCVEVLFHPGRMERSELTPEYNKEGFNEFHFSQGRIVEEKAVEQLEKMELDKR